MSWGPKSKRMVAGIYLTKLWNRDRYTPAQTAAILARGNIAIHVRLKGEMSEACLGLGPNGWAYVASLIKRDVPPASASTSMSRILRSPRRLRS